MVVNEEAKLMQKNESAQGCGKETCGCASTKEKPAEKKPEQTEIKLDPTHFGDWQIGCRAIDF